MPIKFNLFDFLGNKIKGANVEVITKQMLDQMAFNELALHICISYIANALSKCEFKVYENGKPVKNNLYYKLNVSPNPNQNSSQFINKFIERYYYDGNALIVPHGDHIYVADNFDIDDSKPLNPNTFYNVTFGNQQSKKQYKANEVFYIKLDDKNVRNLIDSLYVQYGEVLSYALAAYKRTNGTKYKLILDQYQAGDPEFKRIYDESLKQQLKTFVENDNAIYPQFRGIDLQEFSSKTPSNTSDIISMRKETFEVSAQAFKIPLPMMYGNITNIKDIVNVFLTFCIDPLADMVEEEFTRKSYDYYAWSSGNFVKVDTSCINHVDILENAQAIYNAVGSGVATIDDMRDRLDWERLNTDFSTQYFLSKNFVPAEDMQRGVEN